MHEKPLDCTTLKLKKKKKNLLLLSGREIKRGAELDPEEQRKKYGFQNIRKMHLLPDLLIKENRPSLKPSAQRQWPEGAEMENKGGRLLQAQGWAPDVAGQAAESHTRVYEVSHCDMWRRAWSVVKNKQIFADPLWSAYLAEIRIFNFYLVWVLLQKIFDAIYKNA